MIALSDEPGLFGDRWADALALGEWLEAHDYPLCQALLAEAARRLGGGR